MYPEKRAAQSEYGCDIRVLPAEKLCAESGFLAGGHEQIQDVPYAMVLPFFLESLTADFVGRILIEYFDLLQSFLKVSKHLLVQFEFTHYDLSPVDAPFRMVKPAARCRVSRSSNSRSCQGA